MASAEIGFGRYWQGFRSTSPSRSTHGNCWLRLRRWRPGAARGRLHRVKSNPTCPKKTARSRMRLLNILRLLAQLFDKQFQVDGRARHGQRTRLRAQRIGFPVHFLEQEIKPLAGAASFLPAACGRISAIEDVIEFGNV